VSVNHLRVVLCRAIRSRYHAPAAVADSCALSFCVHIRQTPQQLMLAVDLIFLFCFSSWPLGGPARKATRSGCGSSGNRTRPCLPGELRRIASHRRSLLPMSASDFCAFCDIVFSRRAVASALLRVERAHLVLAVGGAACHRCSLRLAAAATLVSHLFALSLERARCLLCSSPRCPLSH
jgi:hypothetical protein